MSVEDDKKKPKRAPAKKVAAAPSADAAAEKKVKAASPKSSPAKKKASVKGVSGDSIQQPVETTRPRREPTHAEIAERAHTYFAERGHQHGFHDQDWHRAERELRSELS